jgi:hypothetical protein
VPHNSWIKETEHQFFSRWQCHAESAKKPCVSVPGLFYGNCTSGSPQSRAEHPWASVPSLTGPSWVQNSASRGLLLVHRTSFATVENGAFFATVHYGAFFGPRGAFCGALVEYLPWPSLVPYGAFFGTVPQGAFFGTSRAFFCTAPHRAFFGASWGLLWYCTVPHAAFLAAPSLVLYSTSCGAFWHLTGVVTQPGLLWYCTTWGPSLAHHGGPLWYCTVPHRAFFGTSPGLLWNLTWPSLVLYFAPLGLFQARFGTPHVLLWYPTGPSLALHLTRLSLVPTGVVLGYLTDITGPC